MPPNVDDRTPLEIRVRYPTLLGGPLPARATVEEAETAVRGGAGTGSERVLPASGAGGVLSETLLGLCW